MVKIKRKTLILIIILLLNLFLNIYGINWGLPDRWNVDEQLARALHMAYEKRIVPTDDFFHPTFHYFFLILALLPYILFLKFTGYNLELVRNAAAVSWVKLMFVAPDFATNIYLYARFISCLLGVCSVYMVYLIGKRIFNERVGLLSASILCVSMGFVSVNHFVKSDSLLHLSMLIAIYFCIRAIKSENFMKYISLASFFAGLSIATKYNGGILIIPLLTTYLLYKIKNKELSFRKLRFALFNKIVLKIFGFYIFGVLIGWPGVILNFHQYFNQAQHYKIFVLGYPNTIHHSYFIGMINYFLQIIILFGVPIFIFVLLGIAVYLFKPKKISGEALIILTTIIPYFLIVSSYRDKYHAVTRYIIAIIPFLSIFGGKALSDFLKFKLNKLFKYLTVVFVFIFSFFYTFSIDLLFVKNDTRYQSTDWILRNIPEGSTIEMFKQIDWLVAAHRILPHYKIVFYGSSSDAYDNKSQFKLYQDKTLRKEYFKNLNRFGPESEYILLVFENVSDIPYGVEVSSDNEEEKFISSLVNGKQRYVLIKQFSHPNDKLRSKSIKGLSYPRSIFWNPNPTSYTSPVVLIFKKI